MCILIFFLENSAFPSLRWLLSPDFEITSCRNKSVSKVHFQARDGCLKIMASFSKLHFNRMWN
jgi:hypothetical protein